MPACTSFAWNTGEWSPRPSLRVLRRGGIRYMTDLTPGITILRPNGEKGFRIRFKPKAAGNRQASLRIHSDAAESPHSLTLVGVGFARP